MLREMTFETWPLFDLGIRRRLISRFPYAILYSEEGQTIYILAVMHLRRDPTFWQNGLPINYITPRYQIEQKE